MSVYLETSCLLKLLVFEPESGDVRDAVAATDDVVVSSLARLEAEVRLHGAYLGGRFRAREWKVYRGKLDDLLALAPFRECSPRARCSAPRSIRSAAPTRRTVARSTVCT